MAWAALLAAAFLAPSPSGAGERPVLIVLTVENQGTALASSEIDVDRAADAARRLGPDLKEGNQALLGPFKRRCPAELEQIFKIIADKIATAGRPR
jgi:hypothetical protein